jgi:hypothetical protein
VEQCKMKKKKQIQREEKRGAALGIRVCVHLFGFSCFFLFSCSNPLKLARRECV